MASTQPFNPRTQNKKSLFLWPTVQFHHLLIDQRILKNVTKHLKKPVKTSNESSFHFVDLKLRQETPHLMCGWATSNYLLNTKMNKTIKTLRSSVSTLVAPRFGRWLVITFSLLSEGRMVAHLCLIPKDRPCVSGWWVGGGGHNDS